MTVFHQPRFEQLAINFRDLKICSADLFIGFKSINHCISSSVSQLRHNIGVIMTSLTYGDNQLIVCFRETYNTYLQK